MRDVTLRVVEFVDEDGRSWARGLPDGVPDARAKVGVPIGPPSLEDLGLPKELEVRLHNQLYQRRIFTERDARQRMQDVHSALMAALRVDAHRILAIYQGQGVANGTP